MCSTPIFGRIFSSMVESDDVINIQQLEDSSVKAMVVLGCSRYSKAPEFEGKDSVSSCTLVRLRYAALLHKTTALPVMVSGGSVHDESISEAVLMQNALINEFGIDVKWIENRSKNTAENAEYVARVLKLNNINQILLVTHAIHMRRAKYAFNKNGVNVLPAPTYFYSSKDSKAFYIDYLPSAEALYISYMTFYEIIAYLWLQMRL